MANWNPNKPDCSRGGVYPTCKTCKLLGDGKPISANTLRKYRRAGYIKGKANSCYTGAEIINLWQMHSNGLI